MKITQSQLKSLVRTIVKESVSELTKGKRRRSLRENAGKKVAELIEDVSSNSNGMIVTIDGKNYLLHDIVAPHLPPGYDPDEDNIAYNVDDALTAKVLNKFLQKHGVTHVSLNSDQDNWKEVPIDQFLSHWGRDDTQTVGRDDVWDY